MMQCRKLVYLLGVLFFLVGPAVVSAEPEAQAEMTLETFMASLNFQEGEVVLGDDLVTLNLPESFRYLSPEDTERVLVDAWGNPPGNETLGMIVPMDAGLFSEEGWAVIIGYEEDGYVSDEDAENIDYDQLLTEIRDASRAANEERTEAGYAPVEIVGWAEEPYYDKASHKLFWAKEVKFGDSEINTLNYNIRVLGRRGVLVLNIVSGMPQFQAIDRKIPTLLAMTEFNPGNRYADFNPEYDKMAAYGIGALIAGKVATKVGLFAKLGTFLLAFKKVLIMIPIAIGVVFRRLFGRKDKAQALPAGNTGAK